MAPFMSARPPDCAFGRRSDSKLGRLQHLAALDRVIDGNGIDGLDRDAGEMRGMALQHQA